MCLKNKRESLMVSGEGKIGSQKSNRGATCSRALQAIQAKTFFLSQRDIGSNERDRQNYDRIPHSNLGTFVGKNEKLMGHWENRSRPQLFRQLGRMDQLS